ERSSRRASAASSALRGLRRRRAAAGWWRPDAVSPARSSRAGVSRGGVGPSCGQITFRGLCTADRFATFRVTFEKHRRLEALPVVSREFACTLGETACTDVIDEAQGTAGPGREAPAEDRADVRVARG